ncbi:MAG: hypothetical protein JO197_10560 [Acidobacteria bacterium]|nr:hypothetical protein [Acidobacteriota bacterium]MBV9475504.1 hypothetical protein [Acidobacteriota bacterium]
MKSIRLLPIFALCLLAAPSLFASNFGVRAGRYTDANANFVGVDLLVDLGSVNLDPNVEYSLDDDVTAGSANIDLTVDVVQIGRIRPYVGAGIGLSYLDDNSGASQTDTVGNLIGGLTLDAGSLRPYVQAKYFRTLDNNGGPANHDWALTIGLHF